jgi:hypothetical protein
MDDDECKRRHTCTGKEVFECRKMVLLTLVAMFHC